MAKNNGGFFRDVILRLDRNAARRMQDEAAEAMERAGKDGAKEFEAAMQEGGRKAVRALSKTLRDEYDRTVSKAQVKLGRGLIDEREFARIEREAKATFNGALLPLMDKLQAEGKVTEQQFAQLARQVKRVGDAAPEVGSQWMAVGGMMRSAFAPILAVFSAGAIGRFLFDTNRETESLLATLEGTEGSAAGALAVFNQVEDFASKTPFQVAELTEAFGRFKDAGITMSEEVMTAFGDITAKKPEKTIKDFAMAVEDAMAGSGFERLTEFGIKFNKQGDTITATFRGQKKEIENTIPAIQAYLVEIGKSEGVAGAMQRQMVTLNGVVSNLGDNVSTLARFIGEEGFNGEVKGALGSTVEFTQGLEENREAIGFWTRALIASVRVVWNVLALVPRSFWNVLQGAAAGLYALFARVELEWHTRVHRIKSRANELIEGMNALPGVEIEFRFDTSGFAREVAEARRQFGTAKREFVSAGRDVEDAWKKVWDSVTRLADPMKDRPARSREKSWGTDRAEGGGDTPKVNIDALAADLAKWRELKDLRKLTARESAQMAAAERELAEAVRSGTLAREDEIKALEALRGPKGRARKDAQAEEIAQLSKVAELSGLTAADSARVAQLERQLTAELDRGNLSRERRAELLEKLAKLRPALDERRLARRGREPGRGMAQSGQVYNPAGTRSGGTVRYGSGDSPDIDVFAGRQAAARALASAEAATAANLMRQAEHYARIRSYRSLTAEETERVRGLEAEIQKLLNSQVLTEEKKAELAAKYAEVVKIGVDEAALGIANLLDWIETGFRESAHASAGYWSDAFGRVFEEADTLRGLLDGMWEGYIAGLSQALRGEASQRAGKALIEAAEAGAEAVGAAAHGNFGSAAAFALEAVKWTGVAAMWSAFGGAASAMAHSGGPAGTGGSTRDVGYTTARDSEKIPPQIIIYQDVNVMDRNNPVATEVVGGMVQAYVETNGKQDWARRR